MDLPNPERNFQGYEAAVMGQTNVYDFCWRTCCYSIFLSCHSACVMYSFSNPHTSSLTDPGPVAFWCHKLHIVEAVWYLQRSVISHVRKGHTGPVFILCNNYAVQGSMFSLRTFEAERSKRTARTEIGMKTAKQTGCLSQAFWKYGARSWKLFHAQVFHVCHGRDTNLVAIQETEHHTQQWGELLLASCTLGDFLFCHLLNLWESSIISHVFK